VGKSGGLLIRFRGKSFLNQPPFIHAELFPVLCEIAIVL
jgi:hypothetical protein